MLDSESKPGSTLNGVGKQPYKWVEIPVEKFNKIAIPQNVTLLKQYRTNILKYQRLQDWKAVQREQINASRIVKQMGTMLNEMDMLRLQVIDSDLKLFDDKISKSRQNTLNALQEYIDIASQPPPPPEISEEKSELSDGEEEKAQKLINTCDLAAECQHQAAVADMWEKLQSEIQDVHTMITDFALMVNHQSESVDKIENHVDIALDNAIEGNNYLAQAARLKGGMYPLAGAIIGTCVGGPVGLVAGAKIGSLTAIACSFLGYTGGRILKMQEKMEGNIEQIVPKSLSSQTV